MFFYVLSFCLERCGFPAGTGEATIVFLIALPSMNVGGMGARNPSHCQRSHDPMGIPCPLCRRPGRFWPPRSRKPIAAPHRQHRPGRLPSQSAPAVWHGMARYGTVKLRNLRCLGRPLFSVPRCTILYHVVMHVVTFRRFETCQKTCWNMLKLWDLITTRSITEAAFLVTQLLPHQDRGKSVLHQHNVAIRQSEMRAEALKPWHHQNDAKSCHCATQPSNLMVWIQADLQGSRWQHGYPHAHITSYYRVP